MKTKTLTFSRVALWMTAVLSLVLLFPEGLAHAQTSAPYTKSFVISGYYSPLPGQSRYVRGSYEADIRLNGSGILSADSTPVFPGMIAAPKTFPFGTKMIIPGIGTTAVHDRGGAINGERLDVWMGYGEEGMARALAWGKRRVDVTVLGIDPSVVVSVDLASLPLAQNAGIVVGTKFFKRDLGVGAQGLEVRELQRLLNVIGNFYTGPLTGVYDDATRAAVERFQLNSGVIDSNIDSGAGHFGPRTRLTFETKLDEQRAREVAQIPRVIIQPGVAGDSVAQLQALLQKYGKTDLSAMIIGAYDDVTRESLKQIQLQFGVIQTADEFGVGFYGPKTQDALEKLISKKFDPTFSSEEVLGALVVTETNVDVIATQTVPAVPPPVPVAPVEPPAFTAQLVLNDVGPNVTKLQEELKRLNFFGLESTGYYGKTTEHAVFKFQQFHDLVEDKKSFGAGVVGPQTRSKLNAIVAARNDSGRLIVEHFAKREIVEKRIVDESLLVASIITRPDDIFTQNHAFGTRGTQVEKLQQVLQKLGFFKGRVTTQYFGESTKNALVAFQQSHGLAADGSLDFATRRKLNEILTDANAS